MLGLPLSPCKPSLRGASVPACVFGPLFRLLLAGKIGFTVFCG
jgi:hypothetical protein